MEDEPKGNEAAEGEGCGDTNGRTFTGGPGTLQRLRTKLGWRQLVARRCCNDLRCLLGSWLVGESVTFGSKGAKKVELK